MRVAPPELVVLLADALKALPGVEHLRLQPGDLGVQRRQPGDVGCWPLAEQPGGVRQLRRELVCVGAPEGAVEREPLRPGGPERLRGLLVRQSSSGSPGAWPSTR